MATAIRTLLFVVLTSVFGVGCANSTRTARYPDNHRSLRSETLVVEQKIKEVDVTKPGIFGPLEPLILLAFQMLGNRH